MSEAPVVVIAGPTASGKSGLAMEMAEALGGTIVNADSMQVYQELRVLTARPSEDDETRVPHDLYGYRDAVDLASAADWTADARAAIRRIRIEGRRPIVVGGTGLYMRTLMEGIAAIPVTPDEIRTRARGRHKEIGAAAFHAELATRDSEAAARLPVGDSQRVLRAWEVFEATGRALSDWHRDPIPPTGLEFRMIALIPSRDELYQRCEQRFGEMLAAGALEEVHELKIRAERESMDPALPIFKALGYPALSEHLRGKISLKEAATKSQQQTRNYAKRQMTWLRHQLPDARDINLDKTHIMKLSCVDRKKIFSFLS
jgi:tRNA dimethylallyltransferase